MEILFYFSLLIIAFLYASVGHGGASGYLALMVLFAFTPATMRPAALVLNIFVSLISFIQYYRARHFRWNLFWPFAIASIPAAFLGGMIEVDATLYKKVLGILLLFPVFKLAGFNFESEQTIQPLNIYAALIIGALIGLLSGMIGIGGGIILSPLILLLHWADLKKTAAVSALFIFVNSLAGLSGLLLNGISWSVDMGGMIAIAFVGGLAGSYLGAKKIDHLWLRRILAFVLLIASFKLIIE